MWDFNGGELPGFGVNCIPLNGISYRNVIFECRRFVYSNFTYSTIYESWIVMRHSVHSMARLMSTVMNGSPLPNAVTTMMMKGTKALFF